MNQTLDTLQSLLKALEAGGYNAAPSSLVQGSALQVEDLSPVMENVTFNDSHIKLQKMVRTESCKSVLAQFDRQLSYGIFGGSAQLEGQVGQEETSDYIRVVVPMCYYSHLRRVTVVANMVNTVDGKKAEDREAAAAALKIAGDIEFDLFRGCADFSNGGVFDGNPLAIPALPNILGLDPQIRQSDNQANAKDRMFSEYGSDDSVVISVGGTMTQQAIEDATVRSAMNMGKADMLLMDPITLGNYNKITYGKERIVLAGSAQDATGAELRKQWVSQGTCKVDFSRFLSAKTKPAPTRPLSPNAPVTISAASVTVAGVVTPFVAGQVYTYFVTSVNEAGESGASASFTGTVVASGDELQVTITNPAGTIRYYNIYRSAAAGSAASATFIGRIAQATTTTTVFFDLGNKNPRSLACFLIEGDTMYQPELAPYSRMKMAVSDLSVPEAHFRFSTLAVTQPRKNCVLDNVS